MEKYTLSFSNTVFRSEKAEYAPGEEVSAVFDLIATDTDYTFYTEPDDVVLSVSCSDGGFLLRFTMPAHDVLLGVKTKNSMVCERRRLFRK